MKRLLIIMSIAMFFILSIANYAAYKSEYYQTLIHSSDVYTYEFKILQDIFNENPYRLPLLKKSGGNKQCERDSHDLFL